MLRITRQPSLRTKLAHCPATKLGRFDLFPRKLSVPSHKRAPHEHSPTVLTTLRGAYFRIKVLLLLTISPQVYGKSREYRGRVSDFLPPPGAQHGGSAFN